eukprot:6488930-Amphidinium_carterae.1
MVIAWQPAIRGEVDGAERLYKDARKGSRPQTPSSESDDESIESTCLMLHAETKTLSKKSKRT